MRTALPKFQMEFNVADNCAGHKVTCSECKGIFRIFPKQQQALSNTLKPFKPNNKNSWFALKISVLVLFLIFFVFPIMTIAKESSGQESNPAATSSCHVKLPPFTIEEFDKFLHYKVSITIRLKARISKDQISLIAKIFRKKYPHTKRLFICYLLPDMPNDGSGAWASSHFTPDLKIEIYGADAEQYTKMITASKKFAKGKNVIGSWYATYNVMCPIAMTIFRKNGKIYVAKQGKDGSSGTYKLVVSKKGSRTIYKSAGFWLDFNVYIESTSSDYDVINSAGDLEHWDDQGLIHTSRKIK
jgi:hypothetical protein